jgi:hypothetical protein
MAAAVRNFSGSLLNGWPKKWANLVARLFRVVDGHLRGFFGALANIHSGISSDAIRQAISPPYHLRF